MSTNDPMTQGQLDAIRERLDCGTPTTADVSALLAEVERLRALTTVDDAMVERGKAAHHEAFNAWKAKRSLEDADNRKSAAMRAALDAALSTALYHTATHSKEDQ